MKQGRIWSVRCVAQAAREERHGKVIRRLYQRNCKTDVQLHLKCCCPPKGTQAFRVRTHEPHVFPRGYSRQTLRTRHRLETARPSWAWTSVGLCLAQATIIDRLHEPQQ